METYVVDLPVVVGTATAQTLIVTEVPLAPPAHSLERIEREVAVDRCAAENGKVTITGRLVKAITYKARRRGSTKVPTGGRQVSGGLVHCSVEIPFHLSVPLAEAREGDLCGPLLAAAEGAHEELTEPIDDGTFKKLLVKSVTRVQVRVVRHKTLRIGGVEVTEATDGAGEAPESVGDAASGDQL